MKDVHDDFVKFMALVIVVIVVFEIIRRWLKR